MTTSEIREISRAEYGDFLASVSHSPFHRLEWLALVEQQYPMQLMPLGYFNGDRIEAVIPLMRRKSGPLLLFGAPLRRCPVPPATPLCAPSERAETALRALDDWIRRRGLGYVQVTIPPSAGVPSAAGDAVEKLENLELDISRPLTDLWQLLAKKTRYTVRRAVKDGVKLHWTFDSGFIRAQSELLRDTYSRQGAGVRPNYPLTLYKVLLEKQRETGLRVLYATFEGRVVAAAWLLTSTHRCHYWDAVTADEGRRLNASQVLVWGLIRWAHRRGFDTIDFVGTARGGRGGSRPGIGHFKRSMGAIPVEYRIVYWYSPVYRLAFGVYRVWSRLKLGISSLRSRRDERE